MTIQTRPYQNDAVNAILDDFYTYNRVLAVMATGLGKTTVLAAVCPFFNRVLVLAHRRELVTQNAARIRQQNNVPVGIALGTIKPNGENVICASIQTMRARPADYIPDPDLIIIDEAHHAVSNEYISVLGRYPDAKVLGVTATPDRGDRIALGNYFEKVSYRYETPAAIEDGWLSDFTEIEAYVGDLTTVVGSRKTIVFTTRVADALALVEEIGPTAACVHGKLSKKTRAKIIEDFKLGVYRFLVNCNILTEGFDCPEIEAVAMLRPTESRGLFMQCLGRGLRLAPGKDGCLLVNLCRLPEHSLEGPEDALGGIHEDLAHATYKYDSWFRKLSERFTW